MAFWQRALKSVTRRKGKSLILFLVVFILGNVIAGAVAIQQSTTNVEKETKRKLGASATVSLDYQKFEKDHPNFFESEGTTEFPKYPKIDVLEKVGQLSYVRAYDYSMNGMIATNKIKDYKVENGGMMGGPEAANMFTLSGTNRKELLPLEEGKIKIVDGQGFTDKDMQEGSNAILMNKEVAERNNIKVGTQVVFDVVGQKMKTNEKGEIDYTGENAETVTFDFPVKVIGLYALGKQDDTKQKDKDFKGSELEWELASRMNTLYAPNTVVKAFNQQSNEHFVEGTLAEQEEYYETTYLLKSPDDLEAFRTEANALLPEYFHIETAGDQYDQIAGSLAKLGKISSYVVWIASLATIFIISLVILLFLRDRKHELGIYLSLGEGRGKIIAQIVLEVLVISLGALFLSLVTGNLLGSVVSDSLMQSSWLNPDSMMYMSATSWGEGISSDDIMANYQVKFSLGYIVSYLLVGISTILLATILPLLYILRLNPKKIMM